MSLYCAVVLSDGGLKDWVGPPGEKMPGSVAGTGGNEGGILCYIECNLFGPTIGYWERVWKCEVVLLMSGVRGADI